MCVEQHQGIVWAAKACGSNVITSGTGAIAVHVHGVMLDFCTVGDDPGRGCLGQTSGISRSTLGPQDLAVFFFFFLNVSGLRSSRSLCTRGTPRHPSTRRLRLANWGWGRRRPKGVRLPKSVCNAQKCLLCQEHLLSQRGAAHRHMREGSSAELSVIITLANDARQPQCG